MAFSLPKALELGTFVQEAYTLFLDPAHFQVPAGYTLKHKFSADDLTDDIPVFVPFGYIAQSAADPVDLVVAIRGTEGVFEWIRNFDFGRVPFPYVPNAGNTEDGFTDFYQTFVVDPPANGVRVVDAVRALCADGTVKTVHIAGHSLGGALGTMLAIDGAGNHAFPAPTVYTFASPLVGDKLFAGRYDSLVPETYRVANRPDIITYLPFSWAGFAHVDTEVPINSGDSTTLSLPCWHSLQTYLHTLDATRPLDAGCQP